MPGLEGGSLIMPGQGQIAGFPQPDIGFAGLDAEAFLRFAQKGDAVRRHLDVRTCSELLPDRTCGER
jgi:hypothetical protein